LYFVYFIAVQRSCPLQAALYKSLIITIIITKVEI